MEFVQLVPEVDAFVQRILQTGFQTMTLATVTMDTAEGMTTRRDVYSEGSPVGAFDWNMCRYGEGFTFISSIFCSLLVLLRPLMGKYKLK